MPVIGLTFKSINANVKDIEADKEISVNSTPRIDDVERHDREVVGLKDVLKVLFTFETKYEPGVGEITMKGEILYQDSEAASILSKWKKDKKLEDKMAVEVINTIFRRCLSKVIDLAGELRLPPPIQFPTVKPTEEKKN